jgi:Phosphoesterase family
MKIACSALFALAALSTLPAQAAKAPKTPAGLDRIQTVVVPPKGDRWGPGTRIPAIIISPYAKKGYVDHTPYDTTSILQFLTHRFKLEPLPGVRTQLGDLSNAFELAR